MPFRRRRHFFCLTKAVRCLNATSSPHTKHSSLTRQACTQCIFAHDRLHSLTASMRRSLPSIRVSAHLRLGDYCSNTGGRACSCGVGGGIPRHRRGIRQAARRAGSRFALHRGCRVDRRNCAGGSGGRRQGRAGCRRRRGAGGGQCHLLDARLQVLGVVRRRVVGLQRMKLDYGFSGALHHLLGARLRRVCRFFGSSGAGSSVCSAEWGRERALDLNAQWSLTTPGWRGQVPCCTRSTSTHIPLGNPASLLVLSASIGGTPH